MSLCSWRATKQNTERNKTMNMQYTYEWFRGNKKHKYDCEDLKAVKARLEHLPKMMDELNELLKNGEHDKANSLALDMRYYIHETYTAIKSDYEYMLNEDVAMSDY